VVLFKARSGTHPSSNPTEFYVCLLRNEVPGPNHSLSSDIDLDPLPFRNFHDNVLGSATWALSRLLTLPLRLPSLFFPNKISCSWSFNHAICKVSPFQTYWFNHRPVLLLCPTCIDLCQQVTTRGGRRITRAQVGCTSHGKDSSSLSGELRNEKKIVSSRLILELGKVRLGAWRWQSRADQCTRKQ